MKLIQGNIYIEFPEMVKCGVSENTLKYAKSQSSKSWTFINDPMDKRRVLIEYKSLKLKYKQLVTQHLTGGVEPVEYMRTQILQSELISKTEDIDNINNYIAPNGTRLDDETIQRYIDACKYLYLMQRANKQLIKNIGFNSMPEFYKFLGVSIKANNIPLPAAYQKIQLKKREYIKTGAKAVISKKLGWQNSRKVKQLQQDVIIEIYSQPNQYNAEQICMAYNKLANEKGWDTICSQTVRNIIEAHELFTDNTRRGVAEWRNGFDFIIHRVRPSAPGLLWVGDATPYELYYQTKEVVNGRLKRSYTNRKVVYAVIDAYNDAVMGISIGDTECNDLARKAWKNACINAKMLPHQVKTDRYGLAELRPFYSKIARNSDFFTPSKVGNARDKVIEPLIAKIYNLVTRNHKNASGRNIKAQEQPNRDYLMVIKKEFPHENEVVLQIYNDIHIWNTVQRDKLDGKSLIDQWNESANHDMRRPLNDFQRLDCFGSQHIVNGREYTNRLTSGGITVTLQGVKKHFMYFDDSEFFTSHVGKQFNVIYDDYDTSKILVKTVDERYKYILDENNPVPMAFADMKEGDREKLNIQLEFKSTMQNIVLTEAEKRRERLQSAGVIDRTSAEGVAKAMLPINGDQKQGLYTAQNELKNFEPIQLPETKPAHENETAQIINDEYSNDELFESTYKHSKLQTQKIFNDGY